MADIQSNINVNIDTSNALASIKALQSQISAFHTSMAKGGAQASAASAQLQQKLIDGINSTGKFNASIQNIKSTTESFTSALEKNKLSLGQYFKYSVASTKSFGNAFKTEMNVVEKVARERVKSLQTQYINLGRDANGALKAIAIRPLLLDLDSMQTKTALAAQKQQILNQLLHQGSTNLLNFGKNTQWAGRQLMVGFTIPLSMAGTAAAKAYMDIEKAAIKIKRVYGDLSTSTKETNQAVDAIKNLASEYTKYGIAVADTMEMAASAAAMGKTGAELLAQVNEATRLSALGGVEQAQALETTISLTSAFGLAATELAGKINYLNAVENQTVTSIEDLTIAIPKAGPVVKQLGGDVEDLAFFLTAMREGGINASEGANALKSGLAALINPTNKASEMLAGFGVNIKAIVEGNKGDLKKTVIDFATALNTIDPLNRARAIEQMFGKFQFARISTLLQNVTASGSQASKALALANMSSIQLAAMSRKELDRISASPMYKFQKAIADLQVKIAPVGEAFLKAITPVIGFVSKMLEGFNGMSDQFKNFTVIGVAVLGGLAPVLLMVVGLVANGAANILKFLTLIKSFFNRTSASTKDLGSSTSYLTTEQIKAEAVAASLDQIHGKLKQTFTSEASAVDALTAAYQRSVAAQSGFKSAPATTPVAFGPQRKGYANGGVISGPGTGTSDSIVAKLSNGEAVIPAKAVSENPDVVQALISGNIPGYRFGFNPFKGVGQKGSRGYQSPIMRILRALTGNTKDEYGSEQDLYTDSIANRFMRSRPNIAVRMEDQDLVSLIQSKDKRYKSVFETQSSRAGDTPEARAMAEAKLLGLPENVDPKKRPVYGFMFNQERNTKRSRTRPWQDQLFTRMTGQRPNMRSRSVAEENFADNTASLMNPKALRYGNVALVLRNRNVKDRTTFTYGDSYNSRGGKYATPARFGERDSQALRLARTSLDKDFVEAQILGGFTLRDVKKIVVTQPELIPALQSVLRAQGVNIPVGMPRFSMLQRLQMLVSKDRTAATLPSINPYGIYSTNPNDKPAKGFATGGMISGPGTGTSDSIVARVSNGEAIIPAESVARNQELVNALISGGLPKFASGAARIGSGSGGKKNKARGTVLRGMGANIAATGGLESFSDIGGLADVSSLYAPQIAKAAGVTIASVNREVDEWRIANKNLLDTAQAAVEAGIPAAEAFAEVSEKFKVDMTNAEGPIHKFSETAKRIYPELEADLLEAQRYAKENNLDTRNPDDLDKLKKALPDNIAAKEISTPGSFQNLMKVRSAGVAMSTTSDEYTRYGVPKTFVDPNLSVDSKLYKDSASQEHVGKTHAEVADRQADREARKTKKRSMPTTTGEDLVKDSADAIVDGQKKQAKKSSKKVREESAVVGKTIVDASNLPSVKNALDGKKMLGPAGATQVDSYPTIKEAKAPRQSNRVPGALPGRMPSPFVANLKESAQNAAPRLRVAKQEFVDDMKGAFAQLKSLFRNGGKDMVDATKSGLIQETPRLRVAGKEAGFDYVTALKGGNGSIAAVVTSGNQKIVAAALKEYNAGGFKVAGSVSRGLDKGISASLARGIVAGKKLADSISEGVSRSRKQKNLPMGMQGPLEQGGSRGNLLQRGKQAISERASAAKEKISGGYNKLNSKINTTPEGTGALAKFSAVATTAAFALSGIPGPVGQTVSTLLPFISILSAVSGLMSLFSINVVAGTVSMFGLTIPILPLIAAIAGLALVIAGVVWWMNAVNDAKAKELKSINATSKAADSAAGALNGIGKVTGVDTSQSGFTQSEGAVKGLKTGQVNDVNTLMDSQEFNHGMTARYVRDLKGVGSDRDRKDSLMGIARNMQASGSDPKVIADTIAAIQMKANAGTDRKAIVLDPKAYAVGTAAGNKAIAADAAAAAPKINQIGKNFQDKYRFDTARQIQVSDIQGRVGKGKGKITQEEANKQIAAIKGQIKEFAKYNNVVKTYGVNTVMSMSAVGKSFLTGKTSLKAFKASQAEVTKGFAQLDAAGKVDALAAMRESIAKSSPETAAMAATIKDAGLQLLFLQQAAAGGGGAFTADLIAGANAGTKAGVDAFKAAAAKYNAGAQADYKKNNPEVKDDTTGGDSGPNPKDVLTGLKDAVKASALTNQLMSQNYSADFISNIAGADAATQAYYTTIKNGKVVLNEQGKALYAAYNAKTINEFLTAQKGIVAGAALELKARSQLKTAGLSAEDVKAMAARTDVQAALASANATVGAKARAAAVKKVTDALKAEVEATKSLKTAQEIFQESYDKGTSYLSNQEEKINNDFDRSKANIDNKAAILKANQAIEDLQNGVGGATGLNQYSDGLSKLQFTEDAINKKYDERAKALGKIATINQRISEQTKGQLSLAQALASGDIAAAAQAARDMNTANANAAIEDQNTALENAKQKELDAQVVSVNGKLMTRKDIEAASKVVQEQILDIQIKQLAPATTALGLAERARDASLNAISNQKSEWESWKIAVDGATTSLADYNAALAAAKPGGLPAIETTDGKKTPSTAATVAYGKALAVIADKKATAEAKANAQESVNFYKRVYGLSAGGMVPSYFASGGFAKGTDTIPAMLTPGEFVVRKFAVDNFGVDKLNAINSGQSIGTDAGNILTAVTSNTGVSTSSSAYTDASVYNYNVNVNVKTDSNPDQIASAVVTRINQASGQNIRGNRFYG